MREGYVAAAGVGALMLAPVGTPRPARRAVPTTAPTHHHGPARAVALARRERCRRPRAGAPAAFGDGRGHQNLPRPGAVGPPTSARALMSAIHCSTAAASRNQVRAADERVLAGRAALKATEGDIFTEAVGAYMDVIRDRSIVTLTATKCASSRPICRRARTVSR